MTATPTDADRRKAAELLTDSGINIRQWDAYVRDVAQALADERDAVLNAAATVLRPNVIDVVAIRARRR